MTQNNWLNQNFSQENIVKLKTSFAASRPFPHLEIPHFVRQKGVIALLQALGKETFSAHNSDLFQFSQTADLLHSDDPVIKDFVAFLSSADFISNMKKITGARLSGKIDLFGSIYQDTDFLLPHDDQLQGRKIAFMLYLNDLEHKDGGAVAFFAAKNKTATQIVKRIIPKAGTLVFFEVSDISFHMVEEVLSDTQRITLSGWFYG